MRRGECDRNLWWAMLDDCRRRGRGEYYEVRELDSGWRWRQLVLGAVLVLASAAGLAWLFLGR